jgi:hypothetical protein
VSQAPLVSVVIPLYNKRATVARTLTSVLAQTMSDYQVLIIDDGSTDGGPELVEDQFKDPRIEVHRQVNAGPGAARNRGLALSQTKFVTFLDADDRWEPHFLASAVETLEREPGCGAFTSAYIIDPLNVDRWKELYAHGFAEGPWDLRRASRRELRHCVDAFHACSALYRREVAVEAGGFYTHGRCTLGEDVYFWIKVLLRHPIYRRLEPLGHYHIDSSELGISARDDVLPLEPVLTDPEPLRAYCPAEMRPTLELWLAQQAIRAAFMQIARGQPQTAARLQRDFPTMRAWPAEYLKLRLRLAAPGLSRLAQGLKRRARLAN